MTKWEGEEEEEQGEEGLTDPFGKMDESASYQPPRVESLCSWSLNQPSQGSRATSLDTSCDLPLGDMHQSSSGPCPDAEEKTGPAVRLDPASVPASAVVPPKHVRFSDPEVSALFSRPEADISDLDARPSTADDATPRASGHAWPPWIRDPLPPPVSHTRRSPMWTSEDDDATPRASTFGSAGLHVHGLRQEGSNDTLRPDSARLQQESVRRPTPEETAQFWADLQVRQTQGLKSSTDGNVDRFAPVGSRDTSFDREGPFQSGGQQPMSGEAQFNFEASEGACDDWAEPSTPPFPNDSGNTARAAPGSFRWEDDTTPALTKGFAEAFLASLKGHGVRVRENGDDASHFADEQPVKRRQNEQDCTKADQHPRCGSPFSVHSYNSSEDGSYEAPPAAGDQVCEVEESDESSADGCSRELVVAARHTLPCESQPLADHRERAGTLTVLSTVSQRAGRQRPCPSLDRASLVTWATWSCFLDSVFCKFE
jgi:hypothetical protein